MTNIAWDVYLEVKSNNAKQSFIPHKVILLYPSVNNGVSRTAICIVKEGIVASYPVLFFKHGIGLGMRLEHSTCLIKYSIGL